MRLSALSRLGLNQARLTGITIHNRPLSDGVRLTASGIGRDVAVRVQSLPQGKNPIDHGMVQEKYWIECGVVKVGHMPGVADKACHFS